MASAKRKARGRGQGGRPADRKTRYTFTIERDVLDRMTSILDRTGVSKSEQIRRGIRWWLEAHEWPLE
jgi:ribbon-helix-helix protein